MKAKMPALFIGHGSPMNAIEENIFTQNWKKIADSLPTPKAIVCISAHWETSGTAITYNEEPETIHDFGGFPLSLYKVDYPAKGNPKLAEDIIKHILQIKPATDWGLDHGAWSILINMYPAANIPVIQISLDRNLSPSQHVDLAKQLAYLRDEEVLILASGNIVHNLMLLDWSKDANLENAFAWAREFNNSIKDCINKNDIESVINYKMLTNEALKSVPTAEHFLPLLYILALKNEEDSLQFFNDTICMGSLSMTSVQIG